jgi:hypothetical protein
MPYREIKATNGDRQDSLILNRLNLRQPIQQASL